MKLSLNNFKHHSSFTAEVPDVGLVRIDGRSGTGKTSILHAIDFALWGKGRGVTRWNQEGAEVYLEGLGLEIQRTKSPNTLSCNGLSSAPAEEEIQRVLGMNKLEFGISSYVSQSQARSLINLSPAEQLKLIHALSFRDENPEEQKNRIKEFIKSESSHITELSSEKDTLRERILGIISNIRSLKAIEFDKNYSLEECDAGITESEEKIRELENKKNELLERKSEIETLLNAEERKKADKAQKEIENIRTNLAQAESDLEAHKTRKKVQPTSLSEEDLNELEQELRRLSAESKKISSQQRNSRDSDMLELLLADALSKIQGILSFGGVAREDENLAEHLLTLKTASESGLSALESLKMASSPEEMVKIKEKKKKINERIEEIRLSIEEYKTQQDEQKTYETKLQILEKTKADLEARKTFAEKVINNFQDKRPSSELNAELEEIKAEGKEVTSAQKELELQNTQWISRKKTTESWLKTEEQIKELKSKLKNVKNSFSAIIQKLHTSSKRHAEAQRLQALWTKASLDVVEATIQEINFRASYWLEVLLEGQVAAELKTTKEVKSTKETVDSINLEILFRGYKLEKVQEELSGGQYSRVMLAFQLALSDIYNSPILMLDEAAKGCDLETINIMIDALKLVSKRKLVLVLEHNISSSHFDHVIQLEEH